MTSFNPAHVNPPPETTPEEADRNKGNMGSDAAGRSRRDDEAEPIPAQKAVDSPAATRPD